MSETLLDLVAFTPSGKRGAALDQHVRDNLATSVDAIAQSIRDLEPSTASEIDRLSQAIRAHPVSSRVMARYVDAVESVGRADDDSRALAAIRALASPELRRPSAQNVMTLSELDLGFGAPEIYVRQVNDNQSIRAMFSAVPAEDFSAARERAEESRRLLERAAPELAAEVNALSPEIILVKCASEAGYVFHGASSFHLWGSLLLNADEHPSRLSLAEALAHESGHSLLHGLTLGSPMVTNAPDEVYTSPLRYDPRPMEGIVHATYVLARMHFAMSALLASNELNADEAKEASDMIPGLARSYAEGLETVQAHAQFSEIGARTFEGAVRYMANHIN